VIDTTARGKGLLLGRREFKRDRITAKKKKKISYRGEKEGRQLTEEKSSKKSSQKPCLRKT